MSKIGPHFTVLYTADQLPTVTRACQIHRDPELAAGPSTERLEYFEWCWCHFILSYMKQPRPSQSNSLWRSHGNIKLCDILKFTRPDFAMQLCTRAKQVAAVSCFSASPLEWNRHCEIVLTCKNTHTHIESSLWVVLEVRLHGRICPSQ